MKQKLTNDNFILYATKMYTNPSCTNINEFYEDLSRIKYIKRLLLRFKKGGELKERLILNHIIILQNIFGVEASVRILFFKLNTELHSPLKSFLEYLKYLPTYCPEADIEQIQQDHRIDKILRELK
jgi:hypothetical protein